LRGTIYVIVPNFVPIGLAVAEIWLFFYFFFKMAAVRHSGCFMRFWTTHEEHLVLFVTVQNMVEFDASMR